MIPDSLLGESITPVGTEETISRAVASDSGGNLYSQQSNRTYLFLRIEVFVFCVFGKYKIPKKKIKVFTKIISQEHKLKRKHVIWVTRKF